MEAEILLEHLQESGITPVDIALIKPDDSATIYGQMNRDIVAQNIGIDHPSEDHAHNIETNIDYTAPGIS